MYKETTLREKITVFSIFALIPLFVFTAVVIVPFVVGFIMTLTDWNGTSSVFRFIGFDNYRAAFSDNEFWTSLWFTVRYVFFTLILTNVVAFFLALLVTIGRKGQNFYRAGFFTPNLVGGIILGFVWQFIFSRVLVYFGKAWGLDFLSYSWLGDTTKAFWALVTVGVWQNAGYMMLIFIAGLMSIPSSLSEAANLDGAGPIQQLLRIKIPMMIPSFTICLFLTLQRSFMVYDTNLSLTKGGPYRATEIIAMHVYNDAFIYRNFGQGQAKAIMMFLIISLIVILQVRIMKKLEVDA
ncbi:MULTISPECIES: carbohydrate ABC transporter permease [Paenibacillus]|uniref:ABC transporter permease n=1 Tax=Paenibacillus terrae TaxID=159743 RepID=A0A0D7WUK9_9BACL|nr:MULTISPECIES: sugar ABC transporter permease [Paenibacillus]KJD42694.1 ABC transporter permease [Paenibacillus terrae]MCP3794003.1 sugar ABC transporter permease [Paenibacillus sp. CH40]